MINRPVRLLTLLSLTLGASLEPLAAEVELDTFGGWKGKQFESTGYFYLEQGEDRWWLVTPEGNAFLINGQDHVSPGAINRPYNRDHWNKKLSLSPESSAEERIRAFYQKKVAKDAEYLGFNALYGHFVPVGMNIIPYIPRAQTIYHEYWRTHNLAPHRPKWSEENFLDVYSASFVEVVKATGQKLVDQKRDQDPWILAWGLTDVPILIPYEARPFPPGFYHKPLPGTTWPVRLRNLGPDAAGKQAYVALMRERYNDSIQRFNDCYNTEFKSWDELTATKNWRLELEISGNMHEERDNHAFLLQIIDKAWGTQAQTIRKHDSNHLIFGDTLNLNSPLTDDIIEVYIKHFPVIFYQYYGATVEDHIAVLDRLRRVALGVPVFSADSSWSVPQPPQMPDTLGPQCASYEIAGQRLTEVYHACFSRPEFLGWGWCGWMDQWARSEPHRQHGGLQDAFGHWHKPLSDAYSQFGKEMYAIAQP